MEIEYNKGLPYRLLIQSDSGNDNINYILLLLCVFKHMSNFDSGRGGKATTLDELLLCSNRTVNRLFGIGYSL